MLKKTKKYTLKGGAKVNKKINLVGNEVADVKALKTNNRVNIDWLSLNFKGVDAYTLLEVFCNSTMIVLMIKLERLLDIVKVIPT